METRARTIGEWLGDVHRGIVQLPRFQRKNVWKPKLVEGFLDAILRKRPIGVFLVLEVNPNEQPFGIRPIRGASNGSERCRQHLLDGQQRLTALWEIFNRDYHETHAFYVTFEETDDGLQVTGVKAVKKGGRGSTIGNPLKEYRRKWIPADVLAPNDDGITNRLAWLDAATAKEKDPSARTHVAQLVERLRLLIGNTQIPFFSLPQETPPDDAIEIFIETNRSSVRLSPYDLAVAQMEEKTEESLEEKVQALCDAAPAIEALEKRKNVGDLVLKVQCLREGKKPTLSNYGRLDFQNLNDGWPEVVAGVRWATDLLAEMYIWSADRLPTSVPLRVLPPLKASMPKGGAELAAATKLVKRYLWSAFLSERYDRQANDRLKDDHEWLEGKLLKNSTVIKLPNELGDPPADDALLTAGWPGRGNRLGRAVLAACSLNGARDIASNKPLAQDYETEPHHIFPKAVLKDTECDPDLAMNCMFLHTPTNREWSDKLPGDFLLLTIQQSVNPNSNAESEVKERLATHLVPADELLRVREEEEPDVKKAYERFLSARAVMVKDRIAVLLRKGEL